MSPEYKVNLRCSAMRDRVHETDTQRCPLKVGDKVRFAGRQPTLFETVGTVTHIVSAVMVRVQWRPLGGRSSGEVDVERLERVKDDAKVQEMW